MIYLQTYELYNPLSSNVRFLNKIIKCFINLATLTTYKFNKKIESNSSSEDPSDGPEIYVYADEAKSGFVRDQFPWFGAWFIPNQTPLYSFPKKESRLIIEFNKEKYHEDSILNEITNYIKELLNKYRKNRIEEERIIILKTDIEKLIIEATIENYKIWKDSKKFGI